MKTYTKDQRGFTLTEILVAMAIGLIVMVVIGQVMSLSEGQKRTATTGSDSTVNGALALHAIELDAKNSGYGMTTVMSALGCEIRAKNASNPTMVFTLTPVTISDTAGGAPDTIRFLASSKQGITLPTRITVDHPVTAANFFVDSDLGIQENDMMIAVPATPSATNWCSVFQVTGTGGSGGGGGNSGQGQNQVLHNSGQSVWNQPGGQTIFPPGGYATNDYLINLGQMLDHTYSIANNNLRLTDYSMTTGVTSALDLYPQIVQLQAVYGKDTNNDGVIDAWNAVQPTNTTEWQQVRTARVVLVSRSQLIEKENVTLSEANVSTSTKCNTATPNANLVCWWPNPADVTSGVEINLNVNNANPDWQRYRYRAFEVTIPLRNLIWRQ